MTDPDKMFAAECVPQAAEEHVLESMYLDKRAGWIRYSYSLPGSGNECREGWFCEIDLGCYVF